MIAKVVTREDQVPDYAEPMENTEKMAVYGTLRRDFGAHRLLGKDSFFEGTTYICGFEMVSMGGFPGAYRVEDLNKAIFAEVYHVPKSMFNDLDRYEGHPNFYHRELVATPYGDVWLYFLPTEDRYTSMPKIKSGKWGEKAGG